MNKNLKLVLAVLAGLIFWGMLNFASLFGLAMLWPAFGDVGRAAQASNDYSQFTLPMLIMLLAMWTWVNVGAGWLTVFITKNRNSIWFLIAPLVLFALYNHAYVLWDNLANWYNIAVIVIFPPTLFLGSLLVKRPKANGP
ncbi:hypothetical protein [Aurantivibrio infirmus]